MIEFVTAFSYWYRVIGNYMRTSARFKVVTKRVKHLFAFCKLSPRRRIVKGLVIHLHGERLGFWHPGPARCLLIYGWHSANVSNNVAK